MGGKVLVSTAEHTQRLIRLQAERDETLSVLSCGDKNFASHVTTFFRTWLLVFNVDASSAILDEHLAQLHCCSDTTMASVCISNDGVQIIDRQSFGTLLGLAF